MQRDLSLYLRARGKREFFLIHGYTGSPTDFNTLPIALHQKFGASVRVIQLRGHGTRIEDLDGVTFDHLLQQIEGELRADLVRKKKIVIGGVSFGGQVALALAARYPEIDGVFSISTPYHVRFPINIYALHFFAPLKKYWTKRYHVKERPPSSKNSVFYTLMHINGLQIVHEANRLLRNSVKSIASPLLLMHSKYDTVSKVSGPYDICGSVNSTMIRFSLFSTANHNILHSPDSERAYQEIIDFFEYTIRYGE